MTECKNCGRDVPPPKKRSGLKKCYCCLRCRWQYASRNRRIVHVVEASAEPHSHPHKATNTTGYISIVSDPIPAEDGGLGGAEFSALEFKMMLGAGYVTEGAIVKRRGALYSVQACKLIELEMSK